VPVPRKFDRRPPERDQTRINDRIRVPEVRLIGEDGKQIGIVKTSEALAYAQERDLDLVEVAPDARPPVCRVLDYSKYKYEQAQKQKAARRHQQQITVREIKFRPKIAQNDYDTKKGHVSRFLRNRDKVKITIMFRGREVTHPERGTALLDRLAGELSEIAVVEQTPVQDGRNMTMLLAPSKAVLAGDKEKPADGRHEKPADDRHPKASADHESEQLEGPADEGATSPDEADGRPDEADGRADEADGRPDEAGGRPDEAAEPPADAQLEPEAVARTSRPRGAAA
jgi:translation initiation factor IF-3